MLSELKHSSQLYSSPLPYPPDYLLITTGSSLDLTGASESPLPSITIRSCATLSGDLNLVYNLSQVPVSNAQLISVPIFQSPCVQGAFESIKVSIPNDSSCIGTDATLTEARPTIYIVIFELDCSGTQDSVVPRRVSFWTLLLLFIGVLF